MHTRRMLLAIYAVCFMPLTTFCYAQNPHKTPPVYPAAPMTDQDVLLLFAGRSANDKILLTLNNNRPSKMAVEITLYDLSGNPKPLPSLTMDPSESRLIDFGTTLRSLNLMAPLGFLKIHYSGRSMELGAQLTLYPVEDRGGLDSPRSLSVDFASTERHAVAWTPPGSTTAFAISNVAPSPVVAKLMIRGMSETIQLQPNETVVRVRKASGEDISPLVDFDVSFTGPIDALRVFGYIASRADGALPIRAYDPKAATSQVLSAVGLNTGSETHAVVRNLSSQPFLVTPSLRPVGTDFSKIVTGTPVFMPPFSSLEIPIDSYLKELSALGVQRATLYLNSKAPVGEVIAALDQRIARGLLEDIPFRTANPPRYMRGAYPLRWDTDYTNAPMIANTSDQKAMVRAYVIAGGVTYIFPHTTLSPGETALFDVDAIRAAQTPDVSGNKIPTAALSGKFHWTTLPTTGAELGLHGRTELKSLIALRASSFSCGMDCPYQRFSYPYFATDPFFPYPIPFLQDARETTLYDYFVDTYGNTSNNSVLTSGMYPYSVDNTSILSTASINNDVTLRLDTGNVGGTNLNYYFTDNYTYISSTDDGNPGACTVQPGGSSGGGAVTVQPSLTVNSASLYGNQITVTLQGSNGEGGSSGILTINLIASSGTYSFQYGNGAAVSPGQYNVVMSRTDIPVGQYRSVRADWAVQSGTVSGNIPITWDVFGVIRHSQYNTPNENACSATTSVAWTFNPTICSFNQITLRASFRDQVYVNGTGISLSNGILKYSRGLSNQCSYPAGSDDSNTFAQVNSVTGSCNRALDATSVATLPNPATLNSTFDCGNNLALVTSSNTTQAQKFVEDYCPSCNVGFNGKNGHVDNYSLSAGCSGSSVGDYGNFWTANTHDLN
jgi:hypothetical protein